MMTANEARKNTEDNRAAFEKMMYDELVRRVENDIKENSTLGQSFCCVNVDMYVFETVKNAINYLKTLGYNCKYKMEYDNVHCVYCNKLVIKW